MAYRIRLHNFEGPLDLLLFFIKRDELDIYDIPISHITREFLEYIRLMKLLDLEIVGEFLVVAAMLMQIKAKMMLPKEEVAEGEEEPEDPRADLTMRLLEYRRYKEMAEHLGELSEEQKFVYYRTYTKGNAVAEETAESMLSKVTIFHLLAAFKKVMMNAASQNLQHHIEQISATVEEQSDFVLRKVEERGEVMFSELCTDLPKLVVVVTFLALLELVRSHSIGLRQSDCFEDIVIFRS